MMMMMMVKMMTKLRISFCLIVVVCWTAASAVETSDCDKSKCPGPLKHLESMGCKPEYRNPGDCCAYKYNCDHIRSRKADKCYAGGHEYNVGENLRKEDSSPCDKGCYCRESSLPNEGATFNCAIVDCFTPPPGPGCYLRRNGTHCCPSPIQICPKKEEDRPTCVVGGKTYRDGEYFEVDGARCFCGPEWKGEIVAPFCDPAKQDKCGLQIRHGNEIRKNCPPVFYRGQNPQTSCGVAFRCQNEQDEIVVKEGGESSTDGDSKCIFGTMTLGIGDSLKPAKDDDSECVCEVPPVMTCRKL